MALKKIDQFNYQSFINTLGSAVDDLRLALLKHEPLGWETVLNNYTFNGAKRREGEEVRANFHNEIRQSRSNQQRIKVMGKILAWGGMSALDQNLADAVNETLSALDNEKNLKIEDIEGKRIASLSKIYEMWNPDFWVIYDSYSAKGLQWLVSEFWKSRQKKIFSEYLSFPFPPGRSHSTLPGFPVLGTSRQAVLGFVYSSWLARAIAVCLNNQNGWSGWQAFHVEMALFQLGHEVGAISQRG